MLQALKCFFLKSVGVIDVSPLKHCAKYCMEENCKRKEISWRDELASKLRATQVHAENSSA